MKLELRPKVGLSITLAPQLIQSLKMLQMPLLQLEQTLRTELVTNPMLEEIDELDTEPENTLEAPEQDLTSPDKTESAEDAKINWEDYPFEDDEGYRIREPREEDDDRMEGTAAGGENLYDHLTQQLAFLKLSEQEQLIGDYIIGNINPDGYLTITVPEMAAEMKVEAAKIEEVLRIIQRFDPTGVGARDLRESLLIQMREKGMEGTLVWRIVDEHLSDLEKKSILQIARLMSVPVEKVQKAMETIKGLSPYPAYGRFATPASSVMPDLVVDRIGDDFIVYHNDRNLPRLRVNPGYKDLIKRGSSTSKDTRDYIKQKLEQARWLLNAINQRRSTMIRVMEAIVDEQREFFDKGPAFLKPLIMEDIAQKVGMNVATISRVSNGKYVQTPIGVFEIKYFFNAGIASQDGGEEIAKRNVKQRLEEIIRAEDPEHPLSDQEIFQKLNESGVKLARRTVTKYREELHIKPARFRKRV